MKTIIVCNAQLPGSWSEYCCTSLGVCRCHHLGACTATEGRCLSPATGMVREMCLLYRLFKWQDTAEFWYILIELCLCVNNSTNKNLPRRPSFLLKIALRSLEADRSEKGSLGSHKLSYSNFAKLMDPSEGLLGCGPAQMRYRASWRRHRSFIQAVP